METNQLIIALIGACSTLLAALLNSRARQKGGTAQPKRSLRRSLLKFGFYFLLGGGATYWVISSLLPFGRIDDRLKLLESRSAPSIGIPAGSPGVRGSDSLGSFSVPVGSLVLSLIPPERFQSASNGIGRWVPADGRALDASCPYVVISGNSAAPNLSPIQLSPSETSLSADSLLTRSVSQHPGVHGAVAYWYVRIN